MCVSERPCLMLWKCHRWTNTGNHTNGRSIQIARTSFKHIQINIQLIFYLLKLCMLNASALSTLGSFCRSSVSAECRSSPGAVAQLRDGAGDVQGSMEEVAELHTTQTLSLFTMVHTLQVPRLVQNCGTISSLKLQIATNKWIKTALWIPQSTLIRYGEIGSGVLKEHWRLPYYHPFKIECLECLRELHIFGVPPKCLKKTFSQQRRCLGLALVSGSTCSGHCVQSNAPRRSCSASHQAIPRKMRPMGWSVHQDLYPNSSPPPSTEASRHSQNIPSKTAGTHGEIRGRRLQLAPRVHLASCRCPISRPSTNGHPQDLKLTSQVPRPLLPVKRSTWQPESLSPCRPSWG